MAERLCREGSQRLRCDLRSVRGQSRDGLGAPDLAFPYPWQGAFGVRGIEFARQPVRVENRVHQLLRCTAIADPIDAENLLRLHELSQVWYEVQPGRRIKVLAQRLLRVHPLRAADSLQLAAALASAEEDPSSIGFVCFDARLNQAASREGFRVIAS